MKPRKIVMIRGEPIAVYADFHQFELRTPTQRIVCGPPLAAMYGRFQLVADRYLVCTIGGGVVECEFRTFDVIARAWLHDSVHLDSEIHVVGVHPSEPRIAITYGDGIHFWDVVHQREERVIDESLAPGFCNVVAFHPREPLLAVGGYQQLSLLSPAGALERVMPTAHYGDVDALVWVTDDVLATSGITEIRLWNRADLTLRHTLDLAGARSDDVIASADGRTLCVLCNDHGARVVNLDTMHVRVEPDVWAAVFDGSQLILAGVAGSRLL